MPRYDEFMSISYRTYALGETLLYIIGYIMMHK